MKKLQLYINRSMLGYKSMLNQNPTDEGGRVVKDLRPVLGDIDYDANEINIFYLLTQTHDGTYFTVIRTIPPREKDHLAAWIFIPRGLEIKPEDLYKVIHTTTRKISGQNVSGGDVAELRELFGVQYGRSDKEVQQPAMNAAAPMAWRTYNGDSGVTLKDLIAGGLQQAAYIPYNSVLFVDGDLGINVIGDDLTDEPLSDEALLLPPGESPDGLKPYVFGLLLDKPVKVCMDQEVDVVWKRNGFEDVVSHEVIVEKEQTPVIPSQGESRRMLSPSSFQIISQSTKEPVRNFSIRVNGHELTGEGQTFTRDELESASVVVNSEGYQPYTGHIDLAKNTRPTIQLQERMKVYCFEMPVKNSGLGAPIKFEIRTKKALEESPVDGYVLLDAIQEGPLRNNHLGYVKSNAGMMQKLLFMGIGLVLGLVISWGLTRCGSDDKGSVSGLAPAATEVADSTAVDNNATVAAAAQPQTAPVQISQEAIKYLDSNDKWVKPEMEKVGLKGLFEDMNNYNFESLKKVWGPKLKGSKKFEKLLKHVNNSVNSHKADKLKAPFNAKADDNVITFMPYLYKIDY